LIDPINPLGSTYPREEKKAICDVAEDHNLWLIDDITYRDFAPNHTLAADLLPEKTITAYSVSKNCGLAGMRVGSLVGPKEFIRNIRGTMVSDLGINVVGQRASIAALKTKSEWLPGLVETALKNQTIIKNAVDKIDGVELPVYPSAASMMVIDISKHNANPQEVQDKLLYENDIFVRAGNYVSTRFGENFIRVSFSIPTPEVERFAEVFPIVMEELS
jgi:aspartate/methionine/tyrosine aminotransferase